MSSKLGKFGLDIYSIVSKKREGTLYDRLFDYYTKEKYVIDGFNIVGLRNVWDDNIDEWNDLIGYWGTFMGDVRRCVLFPATTNPGKYYTLKPMNDAGAAIVMPGQYTPWIIGKHKGKYDALIQRGGTFKVARDADKNGDPRGDNIEEGYFGINCHHGSNLKKIGRTGAGCQVIQNISEFRFFLSMVKKFGVPHIINKTNCYKYTLINFSEI